MDKIDLLEYSDYRTYLKDSFSWMKEKNSKVSLAQVSKKLGISRMSLKHVLDKTRHIGEEKIPNYLNAFQVPKHQEEFFRELVFFNKAKSTDTKKYHFEKILSLKNIKLNEEWLSESELSLFKEWYYPAISELSYLNGFKKDVDWIQNRLAFSVSKKEIKQAINDLDKIKQVSNNTKSQLKLKSNFISHIYKNYNYKQLQLGKGALDEQNVDEREFFTLTIPVDQKRFQILKKKVAQFRHELHDLLGEGDPADTVMQVNLQSFIVARNHGGDQ